MLTVLSLHTEAIFGNREGDLLFKEAICEEKFMTVNVLNTQTMEPLDSDQFQPEARREARQNAEAIKDQILKLIRIFSRDEMRAKLQKEFGTPRTNEILQFLEVFAELKKLWRIKLSTPLEEVN